MADKITSSYEIQGESKLLWHSWTFWFNLVCGGFEAVQVLADLNIISGVKVALLLTIGNIFLRIFKTSTALTLLKK